jgi:tetratricopeptide (TPR) repeat protein
MIAGVSTPFEREVAEIRDLVLQHEPDAVARVTTLQEQLDRASVRVDLIAALAAASDDAERARPKVEDAIKAALALPERNSETMLDIALAMLIVNRPSDAARVVFEALRDATAEPVSPALLMAFVDRLREQRGAGAEQLLRTVYERLIAAADAPVPSPTLGRPRRVPARRRRFLEETLRLVARRLRERPDDSTLLTVRAGVLVGLGRLTEALESVKRALDADPDDSLARALLVATLARKTDYSDAQSELDRLPPQPDTIATRVDLLVQAGTPERAVDIAESADLNVRDDVDVRVSHVRALAAADRLADAEREVRKLVAEHPEREDLLLVQAEVLEKAGHRDDALSTLQQAVDRPFAQAAAHASLGRLLDEAGMSEQALRELEVALELDPGRADVLDRRARLLLKLDRAVEALEVIESADAESPETAPLRGEILLRLDRPDEALPWLLDAYGRESNRDERKRIGSQLESLAGRLFDQGTFDLALATLDQLRDADEELSLESLATRAELLRLCGRPRACVEQAAQAMRAGFREAWLAGTMADALNGLGQARKALPIIEPVLEGDDDGYSFGRSVQVEALAALERTTDALTIFDAHFTQDDPSDSWAGWATTTRADILLDLGRFRDALWVLEDAAIDRPEEPEMFGMLGMVRSRLGDTEAAAAAFAQAADLVGGELPSWILLEMGDAIPVSDRPNVAKHVYERAIEEAPKLAGGEAPPPRVWLNNAWALLRLAHLDDAIAQFRRALDESDEPRLVEHLELAMALALAGESEAADAKLAAAVPEIGRLADRVRAAAILADAGYKLDLLDADPVWADAGPRIARVRGRLSGEE